MSLTPAQMNAAHAAAALHRKTLPDAAIEAIVTAASRCCEPAGDSICQRLPGHRDEHRPTLKRRDTVPAPVAA